MEERLNAVEDVLLFRAMQSLSPPDRVGCALFRLVAKRAGSLAPPAAIALDIPVIDNRIRRLCGKTESLVAQFQLRFCQPLFSDILDEAQNVHGAVGGGDGCREDECVHERSIATHVFLLHLDIGPRTFERRIDDDHGIGGRCRELGNRTSDEILGCESEHLGKLRVHMQNATFRRHVTDTHRRELESRTPALFTLSESRVTRRLSQLVRAKELALNDEYRQEQHYVDDDEKSDTLVATQNAEPRRRGAQPTARRRDH